MADLVLTPEKREEFLKELATIPNVVRACRKVGISRARAYEVYEAEPDFAKRWDEALKEGVESLEAEMHRRAYEGFRGRPVVHKGGIVTDIVEYSDTLAIFLAKAHAPEKYRETSRMELTGKDGGPVETRDDGAAAARLAAILAAAQHRKAESEEPIA